MKLKKIKTPKTMRVVDDEGHAMEVTEVGVPGLFQPGDWDIAEELQGNEALREHRREQEPEL